MVSERGRPPLSLNILEAEGGQYGRTAYFVSVFKTKSRGVEGHYTTRSATSLQASRQMDSRAGLHISWGCSRYRAGGSRSGESSGAQHYCRLAYIYVKIM